MTRNFALTWMLLVNWSAFAHHAFAETPTVGFNRDIRPILADNCFACHGPDPVSRKASLRLDREEELFAKREGGPVVVRGNPKASPLFQRVISNDADEIMPPKKWHHDLTPRQITLLREWIQQGATWQPHWSLIKPTRPAPPEVHNPGWVRNPIDRFVLAKLESAGLDPAPEATPRALARRLSLDLTGLPPAADTIEQYLQYAAPDSYDKLADRLIASPSYGEHRARYWLDAARYADTHGLHRDNYREIWPYRDWVIDAFNCNMPFDQFTIEQIAGDLLPHPTDSQLVATGFHRCTMSTSEAGTIPEEDFANYARDRVETTAAVWLGLTANCAVCHDHKFDPITTKDFYAMSAFFRNTTQGHSDDNLRDAPPSLTVPKGKDAERLEWVARQSATGAAVVANLRKELARDSEHWLQTCDVADIDARLCGDILALPLNEGSGKTLQAIFNGKRQTLSKAQDYQWQPGRTGRALEIGEGKSLDLGNVADFNGLQPFSVTTWINATEGGNLISRATAGAGSRGWGINIKEQNVMLFLVNHWPENAIVVMTTNSPLKFKTWKHLTVTYDGTPKALGVQILVDGEPCALKITRDSLSDTIRNNTSLQVGCRSAGAGGYLPCVLQDFHIFGRRLSPVEIQASMSLTQARQAAAKPAAERTEEDKQCLLDVRLASDPQATSVSSALAQLAAEDRALHVGGVPTLIQRERSETVPPAHVLRRGMYDQPGEEVGPDVFSALSPMPAGAPRNRLGLAQWLVDADNPLTARVIVNRLWQEVFGTGLVKTSEDFGIVGEPPSHPELLDWLAVEFRESGWDVKHMLRLMVTSATYRQAATLTPEKRERDPENRLLSRGPRFRMDAEMLRDYALAASGELSSKIGGPSVKPYQPVGVWEAVTVPESNTHNYRPDNGESLYRRSLYTFWKRTAPPASMEAFNAPSREIACVRRERSNTPLQALVALNDTQFVEAARTLATRALAQTCNAEDQTIDFIAQRLLCRPLRAEESAIVKRNQHGLLAYYLNHPDDTKALLSVGEAKVDESLPAPQLAAWTMTCNQLMNLDEVLNK